MKKIKIDLKIGFASLDIGAREDVTTQYLGSYKSVFKGRGLEFDSYRKFSPDNDDAAMIDTLASARAGSLMVRQFVEERNMDVFFLIDASNTMILSSQPKLKCEYAAELASSLSLTILKSDDNVGYALFNEKVIEFSPSGKGLNVHSRFINTLTQANNYGGGYNLKGALDSVAEYLKEGSLLIIISDFIGLQKGWEESIKMASSKYSVIGIMVRDPIDRKIPEGMGQISIADPMSGQSLIVESSSIRPFFEADVKREENHINSVFMDNGSDFLILQTNESFIGKIIELFKMREIKWR